METYPATGRNGKGRLAPRAAADPQPVAAEAEECSPLLPDGSLLPEESETLEHGPWAKDRRLLDSDPRERILALYDEFRPRLLRYMRSMQLGPESAEEVIQETFMRLTSALLKETEIENVQGWIVRVAHNFAVDVLKKEHGGVIEFEGGSSAIENRVDPALNPEELYVRKERIHRLKAAVSAMKPQHRQCFQMRAQGFRYRDISLALGISEQRAAFVVKQIAVRLAVICD